MVVLSWFDWLICCLVLPRLWFVLLWFVIVLLYVTHVYMYVIVLTHENWEESQSTSTHSFSVIHYFCWAYFVDRVLYYWLMHLLAYMTITFKDSNEHTFLSYTNLQGYFESKIKTNLIIFKPILSLMSSVPVANFTLFLLICYLLITCWLSLYLLFLYLAPSKIVEWQSIKFIFLLCYYYFVVIAIISLSITMTTVTNINIFYLF